MCCTDAIGAFIPPCMMFRRKKMKNLLVDKVSTDTLKQAQESGLMNKGVFDKRLKHFQAHTKSSKNDPVLLICDGQFKS